MHTPFSFCEYSEVTMTAVTSTAYPSGVATRFRPNGKAKARRRVADVLIMVSPNIKVTNAEIDLVAAVLALGFNEKQTGTGCLGRASV